MSEQSATHPDQMAVSTSHESTGFLEKYLQTAADDALFTIASTLRMDEETLTTAAERRASVYTGIVQGGDGDTTDFATWCVAMSAALAPIAPLWWLGIYELVQGLSLEAGARGVRSIFTSKPSEKQIDRVRAIGSFAVRALSSAMSMNGRLNGNDLLLRRCIVAALGIPAADADNLNGEEPKEPEEIQLLIDLDPKFAKQLAQGLWRVAFRDGLQPQQDERVTALCQMMRLAVEDTETFRKQAQAEVQERKEFGLAAVDACRYLLAHDERACVRYAHLITMLTLPPVHRSEPLAAIEHGTPPVLAQRHSLDKKQRAMCLALAWFAALSTNPQQTRFVQLMVRHHRIASDLGAGEDSQTAIAFATAIVQQQLTSAVRSAGQ